jgi:hypothetical protein
MHNEDNDIPDPYSNDNEVAHGHIGEKLCNRKAFKNSTVCEFEPQGSSTRSYPTNCSSGD